MIDDIPIFRLVHRGHVACHGMLFASRSILGFSSLAPIYRTGCQLYRLGDEFLLTYPAAVLADTSRTFGAPLVRYGDRLSSIPLPPSILGHEQLQGRVVIDALGGRLRVRRFSDRDLVDLATWFTLGDFSFHLAESLTPVVVASESLLLLANDQREALQHSIGDPPLEASLFDRGAKSSSGGRGVTLESRSLLRAVVGAVVELARASVSAIWHFVTSSRGHSSAAANSRREGLAKPSPPSVSLASRLMSFIRQRLWESHLGQAFGAAQSRYLSKMLDLFEQGNLEEALRHAIPTSKVGHGKGSPQLFPQGPRQHLNLGGARGGSAPLGLPPDLFAHLRATYEAAFHQLVNRGQIAEAAFVLSELLEDDARAVAFLESHGRLVEAAKLAELRQLPPGAVVRQWFLAGDRARAIAIARRDGAFDDAIVRLAGLPAAQSALRLSWADHLATIGNFSGAALVVTDLGSELTRTLPLVSTWLDRAIELGGVAGARALALKLRLFPEEIRQVRALSLDLIDDEEPGASAARVALMGELRRDPGEPAAAIARGVVRALVRDLQESPDLLTRASLLDYARFTRDGALQADLPSNSEARDAPSWHDWNGTPLHLIVRDGDRGMRPVFDVCSLARGNLLLANGEAGCGLLSGAGKLIHHFDVPATQLVASVHGDRALGLIRRDDVLVVSRINLQTKQAAAWCELQVSSYARQFDGSVWYVATNNRVCALDATQDGPTTTWQSGMATDPIVAVAWAAKKMSFLTSSFECWTHNVEPHRLISRPVSQDFPILTADGPMATLRSVAGEHAELVSLVDRRGERSIPLGATGSVVVSAEDCNEKWLVLAVRVPVEVPQVIDLKVIGLEHFRVAAHVRLEGSGRVTVRLHPHVLVLGDDLGRVLTINLDSMHFRQNLRL